jgi:hypothetical protein
MLLRIKQVRKLENGDPGTDIILGKGKSRSCCLPPADESQARPRPRLRRRRRRARRHAARHQGRLRDPPERDEHRRGEGCRCWRAAKPRRARRESRPAPGSLSDDELEAELERRRAAKAKPAKDEDEGKGAGEGEGDAGKGADELSREELLAAVEKKTGKKPNPATSTKKLKELLKGDEK